jgi:hypothetical protein
MNAKRFGNLSAVALGSSQLDPSSRFGQRKNGIRGETIDQRDLLGAPR